MNMELSVYSVNKNIPDLLQFHCLVLFFHYALGQPFTRDFEFWFFLELLTSPTSLSTSSKSSYKDENWGFLLQGTSLISLLLASNAMPISLGRHLLFNNNAKKTLNECIYYFTHHIHFLVLVCTLISTKFNFDQACVVYLFRNSPYNLSVTSVLKCDTWWIPKEI